MTGEQCEYCGQEERYGHNALCVMNTVEELRAEIERLKAERDEAREAVVQKCRQYDADMKTMQDALNREIEARAALEPNRSDVAQNVAPARSAKSET